jgi:hypothetical protein
MSKQLSEGVIITNKMKSESAASIDVVAESEEMRVLSACELDLIGGGFVPGPLADATPTDNYLV